MQTEQKAGSEPAFDQQVPIVGNSGPQNSLHSTLNNIYFSYQVFHRLKTYSLLGFISFRSNRTPQTEFYTKNSYPGTKHEKSYYYQPIQVFNAVISG